MRHVARCDLTKIKQNGSHNFIPFYTEQFLFTKYDEMVNKQREQMQIGHFHLEQTEHRGLIAITSITGTPDSRGKILFA